jgi:hypothetical protein
VRARLVIALALIAALAAASAAAAAPPVPQSPGDGAVVTTTRPAFSWAAGSSAVPTDHYEVWVETAPEPVMVARVPAGQLTATATVDLPDDTALRWFVRLVNRRDGTSNTPVDERPTFRVATIPDPPVLAADAPGGRVRGFSWTGTRPGSRWAIFDASGSPVRQADVPSGSGSADATALPDGAYLFRVVQVNSAGIEGRAATWPFVVDTSAPAAPVVKVSGARRGASPRLTFTGVEPGAVVTWLVRGPKGGLVVGPLDTTLPGATPPTLRPGRYTAQVRQTDAAGNVGPFGERQFTVRATTAAIQRTRLVADLDALRHNAKRLAPRAGTTVTRTATALRWPAGPQGTRLYNVQLFRVVKGSLVKVRSIFPGRARRAVPSGPLARGGCYVWRVWPYVGTRGYTARPLGVSDFCVATRTAAARR